MRHLKLLAAALVLLVPGMALAHGWGGWGVSFGFPLAVPYYAPPPVYYPPPPVYYAPAPYPAPYQAGSGYAPQAQAQAQGYGAVAEGGAQSCNAGQYVCPMEVRVPVGGRCYCPGNDGGRVYGTAE